MSEPSPPLAAPEPLDDTHDLSLFDCGAPELNDWLRRRALASQASGGARSYVACADKNVVGYYCLAAGAVSHAGATGRVRRNMPNPVPVMVLGRLAVDLRRQGRGLGRALLRDAVLRTIQAAEIAGIRALLVHAKSAEAKKFYEACGFGASPLAPMTLMIAIADAKRSLGLPNRLP